MGGDRGGGGGWGWVWVGWRAVGVSLGNEADNEREARLLAGIKPG